MLVRARTAGGPSAEVIAGHTYFLLDRSIRLVETVPHRPVVLIATKGSHREALNMSTENDWHYLELLDIGRRIQAKEISSVDATRAQLARIRKLDGELKSYARLMPDSALADAQRADAEIARGETRGPLHGVPLGVKDLCWTDRKSVV